MDLDTFVNELLTAAAEAGCFERISLRTEGPVAKGRGYVSDELFVRFYFNEQTGTTAFALIREDIRIWGIDYDNRRGWHQHPVNNPTQHVPIASQSIREIITELTEVLEQIEE